MKKNYILSAWFYLLSIFLSVLFTVIFLHLQHPFITSVHYITQNEIPVSSPVTGKVINVKPVHTTLVRKGEVLIRLDDTCQKIRYNEAEKKLTETLKKTQSQYVTQEKSTASIMKAQMAYQQALDEYNRRIQVTTLSAVSKDNIQQALKNVNNSKTALDVSIMKYRKNQLSIQSESTTRQQVIKQVTAEFQQAHQDLESTEIRSPVTGYIAQRNVKAGETVKPGQIVMSVVVTTPLSSNTHFH